LYEGGIRVPMIVSWPGHIEPGSRTAFLCAFWDLMPTFRNLVGQAEKEGLDGVSLLPLLTGKKGQQEHDYLYFEFQELGGRQAVREGPWKLVHLDIRSERPRYELYNLDTDPGEENDLAAAKPEIVEHLKGLMREAHVPNPDFPVLRGE
jgi:arylsulfatase A-like enzyme